MSTSKIICTSFDITIVDGRSSQTKIIKSNMHLTDLFIEVPVLATAKKTAKLVITTERGNTIFAINELDASSAKTYPIRLSKSLMGTITLEITTDAIVTGNKIFTIELRGYGWVVSDSAEQDGYYYAKLGSTNLYGLEHPSFRITEELNKIPSFEFEIANCSDNRAAIAAGITDVFRIYRRIYSVDTLMFTGIINGDAIEYLSLERIRITGYASYIDLNWRFHQHLNSADAENVDKVFAYFEPFVKKAVYDSTPSGDVGARQGVATDGTYFFVTSSDNDETILKYNSSWNLISSHDCSGDAPVEKTQINHICYHDGKLYIGANNYNNDPAKAWIIIYNVSDLSYVGNHYLGTALGDGEGCAYYDGKWWCSGGGQAKIEERAADWSLVATHNIDFSTGGNTRFCVGCQGLAWVDDNLYATKHSGCSSMKYGIFNWNGSGFNLRCKDDPPTSTCTQGLCADPDGVTMWFAARKYGGVQDDDRVVKATLVPEGGVTDYTTAANNDIINDVSITYSNVNDALYVGQGEQFFGMQVKYSTKGVQAANTTVVWEYSKGNSVWSTLDILDETRQFTQDAGTYYITIPHKPSDWAKDTVNGAKKFWIRARLSVGSYTTQPKLDRIKMTNTDVYRVYYFDTAADTIMDEVLAGTDYSMDAIDVCPSDTISIVAEYETKLRIVAGIANALTWDDSGDKKAYQWWIDTSKKVHLKQKRGATLGDITGELTILNNIKDYFNLSNRLQFFGNYDGLNQLRAVVENIDSQDTHEIRELAVPEERYNNYIPLKEAAQKAMTYTKAPLQKIAATVTTKYWLDNSFEVGDTATLHATSWDVASQAFQIVRADIGARVTNLDMGISQEHLDALKAGLQRQLDISGIRMHGSTSLMQFGPETMNYQRVDGSTVYPAHLKFEIPSDARYIHKVLVSWKLGPYRADVTGAAESEGHDHDGYAGAGGDFTPAVADGGAHTPTEIGTGAHAHALTLVLVKTSRAGYLVSQKYVHTSPNHTHPKGVTSLPDDTGDAIVGVVFGDECSSVGHCVDYVSWDTFAEDTHQHLNTGLNTGAAGLHAHNLYTATTVKENYIYAVGIGSNTASTDPDHTHTINYVTAHPHTGVYHGTHSDHTIPTEPGADVELTLGIVEEAGGTVMQLTVNGEDVTTVNGNGTDIAITGYCNTGSNTVELYPIVGSNTKGGATLEGRGILFIEAAKF